MAKKGRLRFDIGDDLGRKDAIDPMEFAASVRESIELSKAVRDKLPLYGKSIVQMAFGPAGKMRLCEFARRTGLSATHLCNVLAGRKTISPAAFLKAAKALEEFEAERRAK